MFGRGKTVVFDHDKSLSLIILTMCELFSERYGYTKPSDCVIKGKITSKIINALSSCFTLLKEDLDDADYLESLENDDEDWQDLNKKSFNRMDRTVWIDFMNKKADNYVGGIKMRQYDAVQLCLNSREMKWYKKLDCVEFAIEFKRMNFIDNRRIAAVDKFVREINRHFERLNYGYRVLQGRIVDVVSDIEIQSLNQALEQNDGVSFHLQEALNLYSLRPVPQSRNSIKESITAVETLFRNITGESTFGKAYDKAKKQLAIHPRLEEMIQKMYDYTNQKDTGIRHAKVEPDNSNLPSPDEALFMLVACSATINYVRGKMSNNEHVS